VRNLIRVAGTVSTAAALILSGAAAAGAAPGAPAGLDPDLPIVTAGPGGAAFHAQPTTDSPVVFVLAGGRSANVACWILGDRVEGPFGDSARWYASPDGDSLVPAARVRLTGDVDPGSCEVDGWYGDDGYNDGYWHHRHVWHYGGHHDFGHRDDGHRGPVTGPPHTRPLPRPHTEPLPHDRTGPAPRPRTEPMPRPHTEPMQHEHTDPTQHDRTGPVAHTPPAPHTEPAPHTAPAPAPAPVPHPMPGHPRG